MSAAPTELAAVSASGNTESRRYSNAVGGETSAGPSSSVTLAFTAVYPQSSCSVCDSESRPNDGSLSFQFIPDIILLSDTEIIF